MHGRQIKSYQIKSSQIKWDQIKSNQIKSNQVKYNRINPSYFHIQFNSLPVIRSCMNSIHILIFIGTSSIPTIFTKKQPPFFWPPQKKFGKDCGSRPRSIESSFEASHLGTRRFFAGNSPEDSWLEHVLMEVWFRSCSFLNKWFIGSDHGPPRWIFPRFFNQPIVVAPRTQSEKWTGISVMAFPEFRGLFGRFWRNLFQKVPQIWSTFPPDVFPIFQRTFQMVYFHHPSTNVFKSSVKVKHDFLLEWILPMWNLFISCTDSVSTNPVPVVAMSLTHLIWHMVSVKMRIPSHPSDLSLEYDHVEDWMLGRWEKSLCEGSQVCQDQFLTECQLWPRAMDICLETGHPWSFPLAKCHETQCIHLASDAPAPSEMWGKVWAIKATENNWLHKKWKGWSKQMALQDPASTAARSHSNLTGSGWTRVQHT